MNDAEILREAPRLSAVVIGDICLDRWCRYDPALALPSAETGIPRIGVVSDECTPGAGGTVASNLVALGLGKVSVLGVIGADGNTSDLRRALAKRNIDDHLLVEDDQAQTFTYTKLINSATGIEDLPRVDWIFRQSPSSQRAVLDNILEAVDEHDLILISDQAETEDGVVTEAVRDLLAELAPVYRDKLFLADSRRRAHLFRRVRLKANRSEAEVASRALSGGRVDFPELRNKTDAPTLFVTEGGDGVRIFEHAFEAFAGVHKIDNPVDICGAGDSFAAGAGVAMFLTGSSVRAAQFGSRVARVTIGKPGTGTASPEEILAVPA
jgi:bifunctional ADP-heptose synthase (sugar kinase/adenylyltransferase)